MTHAIFRDDLLAGQTALITGGATGIGSALAAGLLAAGAEVTIDFDAAISLVAGDSARLEALVTAEYPVEQAAEAFAAAAAGSEIKVQVAGGA